MPHDSETPAHGQQIITACACIMHEVDGEQKVLVARRAATKKFMPNVYELPGGHIEYGETLEVGLQREVLEELHVHITVHEVLGAFTYVNQIKGSHSVEVIFNATLVDSPETITLNPEDHSDFEWVDTETATKLYVEHSNKGADDPELAALHLAIKK